MRDGCYDALPVGYVGGVMSYLVGSECLMGFVHGRGITVGLELCDWR